MNHIFETIEPAGERGRWARPQATMNAKGFIKISRKAFELLGESPKIAVLYDRGNNVIALKAGDKHDYNAHKPVEHWTAKKHGGRLIRVHGLIEQIEGEIYTCIRFKDIKLDDHNRLILDLVSAVPAFNGTRIGVYKQWKDNKREESNARSRRHYEKERALKKLEEEQHPDLSYEPPAGKRSRGF